MRLALTWPGVVVLACTTACSSLIGLDEFHEGASSSAGVGGEGGVTGGIGGEGGALGGSSTGGNGAAGGAEPTWPTQIVCTASYIPWFLATFDNVNGSAIGPTNIPGTPLERSGAPISTASGQAETEGNATLQASQGGTFASTDLRIRFAANFGGEGSVQVRVNDPGGFEVELSSQGKLRVASQGIVVSEASFNELPPGQYFVETRVSDVVVEAAVSTGRFPTDPAATRLGSLIATAPEGLGSG